MERQGGAAGTTESPTPSRRCSQRSKSSFRSVWGRAGHGVTVAAPGLAPSLKEEQPPGALLCAAKLCLKERGDPKISQPVTPNPVGCQGLGHRRTGATWLTAIWDGKPQSNPGEAALQAGGPRALPNPIQHPHTRTVPRCLCRKARAARLMMSRHLWGLRVPPTLKIRLTSFPVRKAKSVWLWCTDPLGKGRERGRAAPAPGRLLAAPFGVGGGSPGACPQPRLTARL